MLYTYVFTPTKLSTELAIKNKRPMTIPTRFELAIFAISQRAGKQRLAIRPRNHIQYNLKIQTIFIVSANLSSSTVMQIGDWPTHLISYIPEVNTYDTVQRPKAPFKNSSITCYTHFRFIEDGKQARIILELKNQEFPDKE